MTLRRSRSIVPWEHTCIVNGKHMAYGSVWLEFTTTPQKIPRKMLLKAVRSAKAEIEKTVRRCGFAFVRWAPLTSQPSPHHYRLIWHVCAEVVWDDAYEALQSDSMLSVE